MICAMFCLLKSLFEPKVRICIAALFAAALPAVEVHLSNIFKREDFRHTSITGSACIGVVAGFGKESYTLAIRALAARLA